MSAKKSNTAKVPWGYAPPRTSVWFLWLWASGVCQAGVTQTCEHRQQRKEPVFCLACLTKNLTCSGHFLTKRDIVHWLQDQGPYSILLFHTGLPSVLQFDQADPVTYRKPHSIQKAEPESCLRYVKCLSLAWTNWMLNVYRAFPGQERYLLATCMNVSFGQSLVFDLESNPKAAASSHVKRNLQDMESWVNS